MKLGRMLRSWPGSFVFRTPYTCNVKITERCNLRCGFCGLWRRRTPRELHLDNYRYVADLLYRVGLARVVITGGEPLLRPDAVEITALFTRRGFSTTLLTNGTLATPERLERFRRIGLHDIGISLDTLQPDRQDAVAGRPGTWRKAVEAIRHSRDIFSGGLVEVLVTVTRDNLSEIPELVDFICEELGVWAVVNPVNVPQGADTILTADTPGIGPPMPPEEVDRVYDALAERKARGARILVSGAFLDASRRYLKTGDFKWNCHAGRLYFTIFSDGSLAPCSDTPPIANVLALKPGDFRSRSFQEKAATERLRCGGCIFSCWREASYLFTEPGTWIERIRTAWRMARGV